MAEHAKDRDRDDIWVIWVRWKVSALVAPQIRHPAA